jgi:hypothetical protein
MAQRPVFIPTSTGAGFVRTESVEFRWHAGLARTQRQKSIRALHAAARALHGVDKVLEVSSKSEDALGVALSAFSLKLGALTVECAFQGSKVFEHGGPFVDLFEKSSLDAKKDERLRSSGRLVGFRLLNVDWALEPKTAFYDWLYLNALHQNPGLAEQVTGYSAFTDIEFNPERSINCQAHSVALYVALSRRALLREALSSREAFSKTLGD